MESVSTLQALTEKLDALGDKECILEMQPQGVTVGQTLFRPVRARLGPNLRLLTSGGSALDPDLAWKLTGLGWMGASATA